MLLYAFPKIAQDSINASQITVHSVNITNPTANEFTLTLQGSLSNTGPISATVTFSTQQVNWRPPNGTLIPLGLVEFPQVNTFAGSGTLQSTSNFNITDQNAFAEFTRFMLVSNNFTWNLNGTATVSAFNRNINGLTLNKDVSLTGFSNFPNVTIAQFDLPNNDPQGGITMNIISKIPNPSPIAVQLGTLVFSISYQGVYIGPVQATGVILEPLTDNYVTLNGRMVPHNNSQDLSVLSGLFTDYIAGRTDITTVTGVSAAPDGVNQVPWLTAGIQNIKLEVPLNNGAQKISSTMTKRDLANEPQPRQPAPLNLITGISIDLLDLVFTAASPYTPTASSDNVQANFVSPFSFSLNITEVAQNMTIATQDGVQIANIVSAQFGNATSNQAAGLLNFKIANSPLDVIAGQEALFQEFNKNLTIGTIQNFTVVGVAKVQAMTPIGLVDLTDLAFQAPVNLTGLNSLTNPGPVVKSIDVIGGTTEGIQLAIDVDIVNPSNLQISVGDVYFLLNYASSQVGSVLLPNLTLYRGDQVDKALSTFASASGNGPQLLNAFISGQSSDVDIKGFPNTTDVVSLQTALPLLDLPSSIPGLQDKLIVSASVKILTTTVKTKVASAGVILKNPFTAGFQVNQISSVVTNAVGEIGRIDVQLDSNPIKVDGHSTGDSSDLPFVMNLDPRFVATLLRTQAIANGLDVAPLDALLKLGGFNVARKRSLEKRGIFDNFNIVNFIMDAFKNFKVDIGLQSTIQIGDYSTPLAYTQTGVPAITDSSIANLIPVVGQPIVQGIVDKSQITFSTILISDPTNSQFKTHIVGQISETGPIDATISFPNGIDIYWNDKNLGNIAMGSLDAKANVGAAIDMDAVFTVADTDALQAFTEVLLLDSSFSWHMQADSISVNALGYTFTGIQLQKDVSLNGFQGFAPFGDVNSLTIQPGSFSLFDPPSENAIGVKVTANLRSRSNIGLEATVSFENFFQATGIDLGPLNGVNITIQPNPVGNESTTSSLAFEGRLVQQSSPDGIATISQLFNQYLQGVAATLFVRGLSAAGPNGNVDWLSQALTKVQINDVQLPGIASGFQLIQSITIDNAELDFITGSAYAPIISSTSITSGFQLPFSFTLGIVKIKQNLIIEAVAPNGDKVPVAALQADYISANSTPTGPTTGKVNFAISKDIKVPFKVLPGAEPIFNLFTAALTATPGIKFAIAGTVDTMVFTKIAIFPIPNITVNVGSQLAGLNNLGGSATVDSLSVDGGDSNGIVINMNTTITNPSQITIDTGDVAFDTFFSYGGASASVGETSIKALTLKPGPNTVPATFLFSPAKDQQSQAIGSALLSGFLMGGKAALTIKGTANSTAIPSLKTAFSTINLTALVQGIPPVLIAQTDLYTNLTGVLGATAQSTVAIRNVFATPIVLVGTGVANVTYLAKDYSNCSAASIGDWPATEFGAKSKHSDTPGPLNVTVARYSVGTSDMFKIDLDVTGPTDARPVIYGLVCPKLTSINVTNNATGAGIINNQGLVSVSLTAAVLIGGSDGYLGNIQYAQSVIVNNHFTTPYAAFGVDKTVYCIANTFLPNCCQCVIGNVTACPAPGVCPPFDGKPVPPGNTTTTTTPPTKPAPTTKA